MLAVAIPAKVMLGRSGESGAVNINNYSMANSSSNNTNKVIEQGEEEVHQAVIEQGEEEVHQAEEEEEEVRIWKILDKAVHLRSPRERLAVDKWTMQQDPFQM